MQTVALTLGITVALVALFAAGAVAETKSIQSTGDTMLVQSNPDNNYGVTQLRADGDNPGGTGNDEEALLKWDLSEIPAGAGVVSASVTLTVSNGSNQTYQVYKLKRPWSESKATWNVYDTGQSWEVAGAKGALDRDATVIGSITPKATGKQTFTLPIAVVQGWIDDPSTNHGIIIANASNTDGLSVYSKESSDPSRRPQLTLDFGSADVTPPETTIDSGPSGIGNGDTASFRFSSSEPNSTFECSLDGAAYETCTSPKEYTGLSDGQHTFEVRATDASGNADRTPASRTWTVGGQSKTLVSSADTRINENEPDQKYAYDSSFSVYGGNTSGSTKDASALLKWDLSEIPAGTKVNSSSVALTVTSTSKQTFEAYKLKRPWKELNATWKVYDTGQSWEAAGAKGALDRDATVIGSLTPNAMGKQTFTIPIAVVQGWVDDPSTNYGIIIADASNTDNFAFYSRDNAYYSQRPQLNLEIDGHDTTPPETIIDSGPLGEGHGDTASFRFSSSEPNSTFECRLDNAVDLVDLTFEPCTSPKEYTGLADGSHTFEVRATDALGNTDATPESRTWKVGALEDPVLVGAGDIASSVNDNDEATATLLRNTPGTVFTVGDNVYNCGTLTEYNRYYDPTWGTEKSRTKPIPGNHDDYECTNPKDGADYFSYFGEAAAPGNGGYYSYDVGEWHIVALNTAQCYGTVEADGSRPNCGPGDPMLNWLEADLQANQKSCTLAYLHDPRFVSSTTGGGDRSRAHWIWEKLYAHNAEVAVSGNTHLYERFAPQTPSGASDPVRGIQQFVVGTGGKDLFQYGTARPNSVVRNTGVYGVIKFTLHPDSYDWEFVPVAGQTFTDTGSRSCH